MEIPWWPIVVFILVILAMFVYKKPFSAFLDRAKKIGFGRGGIESEPVVQKEVKEIKASAADELLKSFDNALVLNNEQLILTELRKKNITDASERERILLRFLAGAAIVNTFEKTYGAIWGSQIYALEHLNTRGVAGDTIKTIQIFYKNGISSFPKFYDGYTFDHWLDYLKNSKLLTSSGDTITITLEGREFLKYLIHQGYSFEKPG